MGKHIPRKFWSAPPSWGIPPKMADVNRPNLHRPPSCQIGGYLLLDVEVPLHDVVAFRVRLDICGPQFVRGQLNGVILQIVKVSWFSIDRGVLEKRGCQGRQQGELIRERQNVKHADSTSYGGFAVPEWIPGKTDAWFEILQCGVI